MGLSESDIEEIRQEVQFSKRPLIFYHDDPDGVSSYLLFLRAIGDGKGVIVKTRPNIDMKFIHKVEEYDPDRIFILDIAMVEQEFIDNANRPIVWIDHHGVMDRRKVKYFNPRIKDASDNVPVSTLSYQILERDIWIAMVGAVGDWTLPPFTDKFREKYPGLLPDDIKRPQDALFASPVGTLVKVFSFVLKGTTGDALKHVKLLSKIESPYEILEQQSEAGKKIYKRYLQINKPYEQLLNDIMRKVGKDRMIVYTYPENKMSFTGDVTNELLYRYPDKVILVGRVKDGEVKCSLRSPSSIVINSMLEKALSGIQGYGGGHEHACGVVVKHEQFKEFVDNLKKELTQEKPKIP